MPRRRTKKPAPKLPEKRLELVKTWLLTGAPPGDVEAMAASTFKVSTRQARSYMQAGRQELEAAGIELEKKKPEPQLGAMDADIELYAALGNVPLDDGLAAVDHLLKGLAVGAGVVMRLPGLPPLDRLEQLRRTARAMAPLLPHERLFDAEDALKKDAASAGDDDAPPELEDAPDVDQGAHRPETAGASRTRKPLRVSPG